MEGIIPNEIIYRPKQGFAAPMDEWMRGEWHPFVKDLFSRSRLISDGVMDKSYVESILRSHKEGRRRGGQLVWNLTNLFLWHDRWFEGNTG